jgi:acyl phosphate:glycerol-3-phosphate acyltransferase
MPRLLIIAAISYLLGSIPFGYLLVRIFRGEDVRKTGSGNIGATNVSRKSPALGVLTLVLDALKGSAAVAVAIRLSSQDIMAVLHLHNPGSGHTWVGDLSFEGGCAAWAALFAVLGHMFPVWLKFRGGKGVATSLGSFALIAPKSVLLAALIFIVVFFVFRYVSLASISAVALFPVIVALIDKSNMRLVSFGPIVLTCLLILAKHHENIRRLLAGTESRFGSHGGK